MSADAEYGARAMQPPGDFTATPRLVPIAGLAVGIGALSGVVAFALLQLIALFTNLFFFQRWSTRLVSPNGHGLGDFVVLVPVVGALIIGLIARYGSERIRGHGIPEALESILTRGSRVEPRLALLKPVSAAISIGSGGPFGAEGPIIMTGGAFGSLVAQAFHLTSAERKTLLVAGAAAGMAATFGTPLAAVLLAVELLLFEWKPRSFVPVALACAAAMAVRRVLLDPGPLFTVPAHGSDYGAHADETLRTATHRMAENNLARVVVFDREGPSRPLGELTLEDVLTARRRHQEEETRRERVLPVAVVARQVFRLVTPRR